MQEHGWHNLKRNRLQDELKKDRAPLPGLSPLNNN